MNLIPMTTVTFFECYPLFPFVIEGKDEFDSELYAWLYDTFGRGAVLKLADLPEQDLRVFMDTHNPTPSFYLDHDSRWFGTGRCTARFKTETDAILFKLRCS